MERRSVMHFDVVQAIDGKEVGGMGYSILTRGRTTDTDHDRIYDIADPDDDNDSIPDADDPNPLLARDNVRPCSSGVTGILRGLHYPLRDYPTCEAVTAAVQSAATRLLPMFRSACASPDKTLPVSILGARVRSCAVSPPGSPGYVVAEVETCCPLPGEKCGQ